MNQLADRINDINKLILSEYKDLLISDEYDGYDVSDFDREVITISEVDGKTVIDDKILSSIMKGDVVITTHNDRRYPKIFDTICKRKDRDFVVIYDEADMAVSDISCSKTENYKNLKQQNNVAHAATVRATILLCNCYPERISGPRYMPINTTRQDNNSQRCSH